MYEQTVQCWCMLVQRLYWKKFSSLFAKKVLCVIQAAKPLKESLIHFKCQLVIGCAVISLGANSVDVICNSLFTCITTSTNCTYSAVGGNISATNSTWTGDTIQGNVIHPKAVHVSGMLGNVVYSPDTVVLLMLV